jgi:hypothetical protein
MVYGKYNYSELGFIVGGRLVVKITIMMAKDEVVLFTAQLTSRWVYSLLSAISPFFLALESLNLLVNTPLR